MIRCECGHSFDPAEAEPQTHRLLCGDSTVAADVERVMGGERAGLCFTDPPFNVGYDYHGEFTDKRTDYPEWVQAWVSVTAANMDNAWFFVMNVTTNVELVLRCLSSIGTFANLIVWPHGTGAVPSNRFALGWQAIAVAKVGNPSFNPKAQTKESVISDDRGGGTNHEGRITDIWSDIKPVTAGSRPSKEALMENGSKAKVHHAQMPVALPERAILFCTTRGQTVFDPFLGSGTTMVAAEQLGRRCYGVEIAEKYCAVILERLTQLGLTAELAT
jgi:DNA modification methylase